MRSDIDLSIILPCYNEAMFLERNVESLQRVFDKTPYNYEIIIAEDGSTDGTDKIAERISRKNNRVLYLHHDKRLGRGRAVSNAIKISKGKVVGFVDSDLQTPAEELPPLVREVYDGKSDFVIGSRIYEKYFFYFYRIIPSMIYVYIIKLLFRTKLNDTLAGCKFFNREKILPVLEKVKDNHWFWDTEISLLAEWSGLKVTEIKVNFYTKEFIKKRVSKVNMFKDTVDYVKKIIEFKKRMKHLRE